MRRAILSAIAGVKADSTVVSFSRIPRTLACLAANLNEREV